MGTETVAVGLLFLLSGLLGVALARWSHRRVTIAVTSFFDVGDLEELDEPEGPVLCWCGAELTDDVLDRMDADLDPPPCDGSGVLRCHCGGDCCVCHNHGGGDCPGCQVCYDGDDFDPAADLEWDEENLWPR